MDTDRLPTEITDEDEYWLRSQEVSDSPRIGGEEYFSKHSVARPEEMTLGDLPVTDEEVVEQIDREALEEEQMIGKWQVTGSAGTIERLWPEIVSDAAEGIVWAAKAMTATGREKLPYESYMIVVYTPNYFEEHDVDRVRAHLRDEYDVTHELFYKPDIYTKKGIVAETAKEWDLSMPARYQG